MTARLGDIMIEMQEHFVADLLFIINFGPLGDRLADQWIRILALPLILEVPGHVVYPGTGIRDLVHRRSDPAGEHLGGSLDAMA